MKGRLTFAIAQFFNMAYESMVNRFVQSLLRLIALVWLAFGMSMPVSAWTVHSAEHAAAQVAVDAHHHHDEHGGISVHEHDDKEAPDGGHDHMPCIVHGAVAMSESGIALTVPELDRVAYTLPDDQGDERHASDGLRRPPRHG